MQIKRSETDEQIAVVEWAKFYEKFVPDLDLLHHIPNGGFRNKREAAKLKRMGVKKGIPDLSLAAPRKGYHGLYIEMKSKTGTTTKDQKRMLKRLNQNGYLALAAKGADEAIKIIEEYMSINTNNGKERLNV